MRCRHCGRANATKADIIAEISSLTGVDVRDMQYLSIAGAEGLLDAFSRKEEMAGTVVEMSMPALPHARKALRGR
jgi:hypothetical protein